MARYRKLESPVTLFAAIEREQHDALRSIAFSERKSIADVARQAIADYVEHYKDIANATSRQPSAGGRQSRRAMAVR
jgi:hypothetical protein